MRNFLGQKKEKKHFKTEIISEVNIFISEKNQQQISFFNFPSRQATLDDF